MENQLAKSTIQGDFISAAKKYPENTAVWTESGTISYHELDQRSDAFARWLTEQGHAPGKRIALILPKSIDTIVAIFGSLKAGNAYVPLGAGWPSNRLNAIIENGDFELILQELASDEIDLKNTPTLLLDSDTWQSATQATDESFEAVAVNTEDMAYILYTSGSTGVPKGVCVSHRAAHYFPNWCLQEFNLDESHKIASIAPFTFDLSTFDLFAGLASGGCLYIVPEKYKLFPPRLSRFLEDNQITTMYAVPSTLSLLTLNGALPKRDLSNFKVVLFAGEVFPIKVCRQFREFLPADVQYYNLYGPTETNVCTYFDASKVPPGDDNLPIGLAPPGTTLFLDESKGNDDGTGELCCIGPSVMSGYWGKPNEGAAYWAEHPDFPGEKAYRTGDICYQDDAGNWIYKGRADKMVKIFGYRVELGEIESGLLKHKDVEQCAVVKRDKLNNMGEELVAFIIPKHDSVDHTELFKHSKTYLPHFMVPSHIYELESFPLNNSGKIDRLALESMAVDYQSK